MPIQFTPTFFTRPTTAAPTPVAKVAVASQSEQNFGQKMYSIDHIPPKHSLLGSSNGPLSPFNPRTSPLSSDSERYEDIDWTKHEVITQAGTRVKFGAPRFSKSKSK
jgi:hypothetical protein